MIKVEQLTKKYAGITAIDRLTFEVGRGEIVGFLGPNGAGKTTTMRILAGYMPATSGRACIGKYDVFRESLQARRCLGYLPENVPLYHEMRVSEYLRFRGSLKGLRGSGLRRRIGALVELCGLREVDRKVIANLSKGFRQRVGLAEALIHEPALLILDEPTIGLDPNQIRQVRELIKALGERHTILLSTHILSEVEMTCSRVLIIHRGRIEASDSPANLVRQLRTSGVIRLEVRTAAEDPKTAISSVPGVKEVTVVSGQDNWLTCIVRTEANLDLRASLFDVAAERRWQLRELTQDRATLEDVFVELTHTDA
jgi:ABC-2 type transport system ATP-binding protein